MTSKVQLACIAGGISVGVLCCFGGGAVRRGGGVGGGGLQVNLKSRLPQFFYIIEPLTETEPGEEVGLSCFDSESKMAVSLLNFWQVY